MAKENVNDDQLNEQEISTSVFAAIVGKSAVWIRQLTRDGVLKQVGRGKYLLGESIQAYCEHVSGGKEEAEKPRLVDHKTEHERIKAEIAALELEELRGNMHTTQDIEEAWGGLLVDFRKRLMSLPPKISANIAFMSDEQKIRQLLSTEISEALRLLAQYDPNDKGAGDD